MFSQSKIFDFVTVSIVESIVVKDDEKLLNHYY